MLVARDLHAVRGDRSLFRGLSLYCETGEIVAIHGRSGSGKTTLLRILAALDDADGGTIHLDGRDGDQWGWPAFRRALCFVHQQAVVGEGSIREVLNYPFTLGVAGQATLNEVDAKELLQRLNLLKTLDTEARTLSQGEKQRLALIRALLPQPKVLLLDEPTSALDEESRDAVENLLKEKAAAGLSIVLVTHDKAQAARLCDRVIELQDSGRQSQGQESDRG